MRYNAENLNLREISFHAIKKKIKRIATILLRLTLKQVRILFLTMERE